MFVLAWVAGATKAWSVLFEQVPYLSAVYHQETVSWIFVYLFYARMCANVCADTYAWLDDFPEKDKTHMVPYHLTCKGLYPLLDVCICVHVIHCSCKHMAVLSFAMRTFTCSHLCVHIQLPVPVPVKRPRDKEEAANTSTQKVIMHAWMNDCVYQLMHIPTSPKSSRQFFPFVHTNLHISRPFLFRGVVPSHSMAVFTRHGYKAQLYWHVQLSHWWLTRKCTHSLRKRKPHQPTL
jgi:hypothetical protein